MSTHTPLLQLINPDWQTTWSGKEIAEEIPGFQFQGAGWYQRQGNWLLVINTDTPDVYTLQVFYDRDPRIAYEAMAKASVHLHDQVPTESKPVRYGGLLVLVIGLFLFLPLSAGLMHWLGGWGTVISLAILLGWWQITKWMEKKT